MTRRECSFPCVGAVDDELCLRVAHLFDLHVGAQGDHRPRSSIQRHRLLSVLPYDVSEIDLRDLK